MANKVSGGQPLLISAREWNRHIEASDAYHGQKSRGDLLPGASHVPLMADRVRVKNVSGGDLPAGSVVQLGDFSLSDVKNQYLWFEADEPDDAGAVHAILRRPIPNGEYGEAQLLGVVVAKVNVNDVGHTCCLIEEGETELESSPIGPHRLIHAPGTGSQLCAVVMGGGIMMAHCVCDESGGIDQDATGTVTIGGDAVEAENHSGLMLDDDARGFAYIEGGKVFVQPLECPA